MNESSVQLRVTSIRSRGRIGGVIFSGVTGSGESYVAACNYTLIPDASIVEKGQIWLVTGWTSQRTSIQSNGFKLQERQIEACEAELLRPAGKNIISWIAASPDCQGIGQVKAQKLYNRFGQELPEIIAKRQLNRLTEVISETMAETLCNAFEKFKVASALQWLDQVGLPMKIGAGVVAYFKDETRARIEANPYLLTSFEASWKRVDEYSRNRLGIALDDPRRLASATEEALYSGMDDGHTCLPERIFLTRLENILKVPELTAKALAAVQSTDESTASIHYYDGIYQSAGMKVIESHVAQRLKEMVTGENAVGQIGLFTQSASGPHAVDQVVEEYEALHGIQLSVEQKQAVRTSSNSPMSLILGGAGTGKTTVLKALYQVIEDQRPGSTIYQLALAGRAAQRMAEATGRASMTIAAFLVTVKPEDIMVGSTVVVDEMSMVDVILIYRLLRHIPRGVHLHLVGDPAQLPPIGPGLVLHALVGLTSIPQTELKVVKRQSATSGIPLVAAAIRSHQLPDWAEYPGMAATGVSFIPCGDEQIEKTVQSAYADLGGTGVDYSVQILSMTNANVGGVINLNTALHNRYRNTAEQVYCHDREFDVVGAQTLDRLPLYIGDLVMFMENDYTLGLRNGSLGRIVEALPVEDSDSPCCICEFEGVEYILNSTQLQALKHAYAITVHKSQGSQFKRVIVPIRKSRLLDQTLIYTAVTRAIEQVVLVGDINAAHAAIKAPPSAARRNVALPGLMLN